MAEAEVLSVWNVLLTLEELNMRNFKLIHITVLWNTSIPCLTVSPPKLWCWSSVDAVGKQSHEVMVRFSGLSLNGVELWTPTEASLLALLAWSSIASPPEDTARLSSEDAATGGGGSILQAENIVYWICQCLGHGLAASCRKLLPFCLL